MEAPGYLVGGVGVFFVGLHLLSAALKQMAGRRFRLNFAKWVGTPFKAGIVGFFAGFLSQSMSALSFIVGSLVGAGMLPARHGILTMFWANAGVGIIILLAVLNIKVVVLMVLGLAGLAFAFKRPRHMETLSQALFGGAMLFYGLIMIRTGVEPLAAMPWFEAFLIESHSAYILVFLAGVVLTALCQSSTAVSILAISLTQVSLFSIEQTIMVIYGANVGSGVISWILSAAVKGTPKQLIMSQVFFNIIAAMFFVPLFYIEILTGYPLVLALMQRLPLPLEQQAALVFLLFNWGGAVILSFLLNPFYKGIVYFWPSTIEEEWSRPKYLEDIMGIPEVALTLLDKEQTNLMCRLTGYPEVLINQDESQLEKITEALHVSFRSVSREVTSQAAEASKQPLSLDGLELLLIIQNKQKQMDELNDLLNQFNQTYPELSRSLREKFQSTFLQSLDFLLQTACEIEVSGDIDDAENLFGLTRDKGEVFQSIRASYLSGEREMSLQERNSFLEMISLFERTIWVLGRIAGLQCAQKKLEIS